MAEVLDYYTITTYANDQEFELDPTGMSFSMADSIYSLYNYLTFSLNDHTGLLQEYFGTTEGLKLRLEYGTPEQSNICTYAIRKNELSDISIIGTLAGTVDIEMVNYWRNTQSIRSKAYQNTITAIISELIRNQGFSDTDLEDTGNNDYWYQMMTTDGKFINDVLLPNAFKSGDNSPFYAYITSDNVFHLKNLASMLNTSVVDEINYRPVGHSSSKEEYQTLQIRRWNSPSEEHYNDISRRVFTISRTDGSITENDDGITSYPPKVNRSMAIMNVPSDATGYYDVGFENTETGPRENNKGLKINSMRKSTLTEHFLVMMPFNPKMLAGKLVQLNIYSADDPDKLLHNFSSKYVIENSEHVWDGPNHKGFTKLILGRKYTNVIPSSYLLKPKLL